MIQKAHVGIGIEGREGSEAFKASDFSIPEFQGLTRLILFHGRNSYITRAKFVFSNLIIKYDFCVISSAYIALGSIGRDTYNSLLEVRIVSISNWM